MSLRARLVRTPRRAASAAPGRAFRAPALLLPVLLLLLSASPSEAQRSATARAVVQIPTVSQLDVQPVSTSLASTANEGTGLLRVRVRANHRWEVVVAVPADLDGPVWVRAVGAEQRGAYRRVEPGAEAAVASGDGGETEVRVEYRWTPTGSDTPGTLPLTCTLASL